MIKVIILCALSILVACSSSEGTNQAQLTDAERAQLAQFQGYSMTGQVSEASND